MREVQNEKLILEKVKHCPLLVDIDRIDSNIGYQIVEIDFSSRHYSCEPVLSNSARLVEGHYVLNGYNESVTLFLRTLIGIAHTKRKAYSRLKENILRAFKAGQERGRIQNCTLEDLSETE